MVKGKIYQCRKCGAVHEKKKKLCKPERVNMADVKEKDLERKPCKKK